MSKKNPKKYIGKHSVPHFNQLIQAQAKKEQAETREHVRAQRIIWDAKYGAAGKFFEPIHYCSFLIIQTIILALSVYSKSKNHCKTLSCISISLFYFSLQKSGSGQSSHFV
jgi:hypothetical protein